LKDVQLHGTKIEANANRYTFVWGKTVKYNKEKIIKQLNELWDYTQKIAAHEPGSDTDSYQCTLGRKLKKNGSRKRISENGYEQQYII
jgi:hypothetical protein